MKKLLSLTDPVGPPPQDPYLNAVAEIETGLEPRALLERLLEIAPETIPEVKVLLTVVGGEEKYKAPAAGR